eukprot:TRINITY_DN28705_c1_g3_i1.p1 TRINITY_DN28705_c1_g3~~TRINITY_DN28705_c1_g3_i1.p1  ORF type:complete len:1084 (-),score=226.26 TRINITY_DN28705_c1_g3_i1:58-3309(-)
MCAEGANRLSTGEEPPAPTPGLENTKIILVGDAKVGKSSFLSQWYSGQFTKEYWPTVSPEYNTKEVVVKAGTEANPSAQDVRVKLQVWDMGFADTDFVQHFPVFVQLSKGAILCYDVSKPDTLEGVFHWHQQVLNLLGPNVVFIVVGCKSDRKAAPGVLQKARDWSVSINAKHLEVSVIRPGDSARMFETMGAEIVYSRKAGGASKAIPRSPEALIDLTGHIDSWKPLVKMAILGEGAVGKSLLCQKIGKGEDQEFLPMIDYYQTPGPEMLSVRARQPHFSNSVSYFKMFDASARDYKEDAIVSSALLDKTDCVLIVYDVCRRSTFRALPDWINLVRAYGPQDVLIAVIGNKADQKGDLSTKRSVLPEEAKRKSELWNVPFFECSAREQKEWIWLLEKLVEPRSGVNWAAIDQELECMRQSEPPPLTEQERKLREVVERTDFTPGPPENPPPDCDNPNLKPEDARPQVLPASRPVQSSQAATAATSSPSRLATPAATAAAAAAQVASSLPSSEATGRKLLTPSVAARTSPALPTTAAGATSSAASAVGTAPAARVAPAYDRNIQDSLRPVRPSPPATLETVGFEGSSAGNCTPPATSSSALSANVQRPQEPRMSEPPPRRMSPSLRTVGAPQLGLNSALNGSHGAQNQVGGGLRPARALGSGGVAPNGASALANGPLGPSPQSSPVQRVPRKLGASGSGYLLRSNSNKMLEEVGEAASKVPGRASQGAPSRDAQATIRWDGAPSAPPEMQGVPRWPGADGQELGKSPSQGLLMGVDSRMQTRAGSPRLTPTNRGSLNLTGRSPQGTLSPDASTGSLHVPGPGGSLQVPMASMGGAPLAQQRLGQPVRQAASWANRGRPAAGLGAGTPAQQEQQQLIGRAPPSAAVGGSGLFAPGSTPSRTPQGSHVAQGQASANGLGTTSGSHASAPPINEAVIQQDMQQQLQAKLQQQQQQQQLSPQQSPQQSPMVPSVMRGAAGPSSPSAGVNRGTAQRRTALSPTVQATAPGAARSARPLGSCGSPGIGSPAVPPASSARPKMLASPGPPASSIPGPMRGAPAAAYGTGRVGSPMVPAQAAPRYAPMHRR